MDHWIYYCMQFFPLWSNHWVRNHIVNITDDFHAFLIVEFVLLVIIHFPCLLKLCLFTLFFIIWQNILLIHILIILCLCLLQVIPRPSTSINTCLLVTRFPPTVVLTYNYGEKFAVQLPTLLVLYVIGANNLPSDPTITILKHYQTLVQNIRKHNP